jgi:hypothetical protein
MSTRGMSQRNSVPTRINCSLWRSEEPAVQTLSSWETGPTHKFRFTRSSDVSELSSWFGLVDLFSISFCVLVIYLPGHSTNFYCKFSCWLPLIKLGPGYIYRNWKGNQCWGWLEYLHRSPVSRKRWRKGNPLPGGIAGLPCFCGM